MGKTRLVRDDRVQDWIIKDGAVRNTWLVNPTNKPPGKLFLMKFLKGLNGRQCCAAYFHSTGNRAPDYIGLVFDDDWSVGFFVPHQPAWELLPDRFVFLNDLPLSLGPSLLGPERLFLVLGVGEVCLES